MTNFQLIKFISNAFAGKSNGKFGNFIKSVAFISIFLGTFALIISLSVLDGFDKSLRENAAKFSAHIIIKSFNKEPFYNYGEAISFFKNQIPEIKNIQPIIEREGLVKSKNTVDGVLIRGIYPEQDITEIKKLITQGKFEFSDSNAKEVLISKRMSDKLGVKLNDGIVLFGLDGDSNLDLPEPKVGKFKVVGIYESGMAKYDDVLVFLPYNSAAKFFNLSSNACSVLEVTLNDVNRASEVSVTMDSLLRYPFYSITIFDLHQAMFSWIELQKEPIPLVLGLISLVAVLNIITALLIIVVEKTKTIGILRTIGMNSKNILAIFIFQGLKIGIGGTFSGVATAYFASWLQVNYGLIKLNGEIYFLDKLPMDISLWHYEIVVGISILFTFLATIIPAIIAVKLNPVNAIKFR